MYLWVQSLATAVQILFPFLKSSVLYCMHLKANTGHQDQSDLIRPALSTGLDYMTSKVPFNQSYSITLYFTLVFPTVAEILILTKEIH